MLTIPLYVFLFFYLGFLLFLAAFVFLNLGHLFYTGTLTVASFVMTLFFGAATAIIIWATWYLLRGVGWQLPVVIWNNAWFGSVFGLEQIFSPFTGNQSAGSDKFGL